MKSTWIKLIITAGLFKWILNESQESSNVSLDLENITFSFSCKDKAIGFYADVDYNCQIFHMCNEEGKRVPHVCANDTSFNQEYRICDWEYNFNCSEAPKWYYLNELTYATDPPSSDDQNFENSEDG